METSILTGLIMGSGATLCCALVIVPLCVKDKSRTESRKAPMLINACYTSELASFCLQGLGDVVFCGDCSTSLISHGLQRKVGRAKRSRL